MTCETQHGFDLLISFKLLFIVGVYLGTWLLLAIIKSVSA